MQPPGRALGRGFQKAPAALRAHQDEVAAAGYESCMLWAEALDAKKPDPAKYADLVAGCAAPGLTTGPAALAPAAFAQLPPASPGAATMTAMMYLLSQYGL